MFVKGVVLVLACVPWPKLLTTLVDDERFRKIRWKLHHDES